MMSNPFSKWLISEKTGYAYPMYEDIKTTPGKVAPKLPSLTGSIYQFNSTIPSEDSSGMVRTFKTAVWDEDAGKWVDKARLAVMGYTELNNVVYPDLSMIEVPPEFKTVVAKRGYLNTYPILTPKIEATLTTGPEKAFRVDDINAQLRTDMLKAIEAIKDQIGVNEDEKDTLSKLMRNLDVNSTYLSDVVNNTIVSAPATVLSSTTPISDSTDVDVTSLTASEATTPSEPVSPERFEKSTETASLTMQPPRVDNQVQ